MEEKKAPVQEEEQDFGDFEDVSEAQAPAQAPNAQNVQGYVPTRVRVPRGNEKIGLIVQRYGGNRMEIHSTDGKTRNCRVPGRFRRHLWLRPKDFVLITPWVDDDEKGDIIYKYSGGEISQLRKRGMLTGIKEGF